MPWTRKQVRYLESSGSPLTTAQKSKMNAELHADPSMGHHKKGSNAMKHGFHETRITHHEDGSHTVEHVPRAKPSKSGAFHERGQSTSYSAANTQEMMSKMGGHLGMEADHDEEG